MQASPRRVLFLNTCWKSIDRVNLSRLRKDSLIRASTLWRETRSALGSAGSNYTTTTASLHTRTKPVRSGTFQITGLECTLHVKRLGSLFVDFNKARQCTGRVDPRQYLIDTDNGIFANSRADRRCTAN